MSECEHDFFTVQSEDSRCMNCGETESSIQSWQYVLRIAEQDAEIAELEAELDRAANEIHRLGAKSSQQEDTIAELRERERKLKATIAEQRKLMQAVVGAKENYPNNIICGAEGELAKSIDAMAEYLEKK